MTTNRYDSASQAFHWVTALTVLAAYAVGLRSGSGNLNSVDRWVFA